MWDVLAMNFMNCRKGVFLDLDGTILNTELINMELMLKYNKLYGKKVPKSFYRKNMVGKTKNEISKILSLKWGIDFIEEKYWNGLLNLRSSYYEKNEIKIKTGFYDLIDYLKSNNWDVALITSNQYIQVQKLLTKAKIDKNIFDVIITRDNVKCVKPSSEPYLLAMQKLYLDPQFVFVIEDSNVGLRAAQNLNIKTICVKDLCKIDKSVRQKCYSKVKTLKNVTKILKEWIKYEYY